MLLFSACIISAWILSVALPNTDSYSSLNTYCAAIFLLSSVNEVGSHPLAKWYFKRVACLKPKRPRYDFIWDPSPVIQYLAFLYLYEREPIIRAYLQKACFVSTHNCTEITNLSNYSTLSNFKYIGWVGFQQGLRHLKWESQPLLIFRQFRENPEFYVFSLFKFYVNFTWDLRQIECDTLFISPRLS